MYEHENFLDPKDLWDNPHARACPYCKQKLDYTSLKDSWPISDEELHLIHEQTKIGYKEIHDLEDCYLDLLLDTQDTEIWLNFCRFCGWWRIVKDICICAKEWQIWDIFFGCVGSLKNLCVNENLRVPFREIRNFMVRNYESRFNLNPRIFEEVVASVFKDVGYHTHVTGYSNDGGIDIIMGKPDQTLIGVQVKRYKNKIKVDQIRSFAGALILGGFTKGVFVTTSEYQSGAYTAADSFSSKTLPIELIDAQKFYDALKIAQKQSFDLYNLYYFIEHRNIQDIFYYGWDTPRNSL